MKRPVHWVFNNTVNTTYYLKKKTEYNLPQDGNGEGFGMLFNI